MEIYLHKILPILILPTGILLLLLIAGFLMRNRMATGLALLMFWLSSTPLLSEYLIRVVENHAERVETTFIPQADAIVVLSDGRPIAPGPAAISEWGDGDRFWAGVELYQAGKAPLVIFTGGWVPWIPNAKPDGEIAMSYAERLGIPSASMKVTGKAFNTAEEAQEVANILGSQSSILLVTSAFHMPRSQALFKSAGLSVLPYPVDFKVNAGKVISVIDFLPKAEAFRQTELAWRELLGRAYYTVKIGLR